MSRNIRAIGDIARNAARRNPGKTISTASLDNLDPALLDAYMSGERVKVTDGRGFTRTGRVSVSLGWHPVALLVHRSNQRGSSDVLSADDRVIEK